MSVIENLLLNNKAWAEDRIEENPDYFKKLAALQTPEYLWIGCSDSRVPANEVTGTAPGEIFVHRNIANMVVHTDINLLSVLTYAVDVLEVKHIIVCGHYGCGGVKAAIGNDYLPLINNWLRNIKDVYKANRTELKSIQDEEKQFDRLVELNVLEQVHHLAETNIVQGAWKKREMPLIHGWVYGLNNGIINPLITIGPDSEMDPLYKYNNL
ncbi:MAG: carbonate dehydratase [Flavobacteriales bacterium]|jgi:carbonic anhydrase|nr:carbonate dehydratase [Flavobacteriales bacterium]MDP4818825.1 carbonate dehydratase [Flavobacteriales bacterium]